MKELSLHILDIAQNSISAEADVLRIAIIEDLAADRLTIKIKDDGVGMDEETVTRVTDPFYTTRTTRKVGLGIPLFKAGAEACDGHFAIHSEPGVGTEIEATFRHSHIDRVPLGNMTDTLIAIITADLEMDLIYTHCVGREKFTLNTREIKKILGDVPLDQHDVISWLRSYISEGLDHLYQEEAATDVR